MPSTDDNDMDGKLSERTLGSIVFSDDAMEVGGDEENHDCFAGAWTRITCGAELSDTQILVDNVELEGNRLEAKQWCRRNA